MIAEALGDVSDRYIWRFPRQQGIDLYRGRSRYVSTHRSSRLYPLDNAVVPAGHEKPDFRGMAWAQGYPKLPNRKTQTELRDIRVIEIQD